MTEADKRFFWDSIYTVEFSILVEINDHPPILIPDGYKDDGHTFIPDCHEPASTGLPKAIIAHPHDFLYEHRIRADGTMLTTEDKGWCDQVYKEMWDASNRWIKRGLSGTVLRGLRIAAGPTWDRRKFPKPLRPEWEHLFGTSTGAVEAQMRMPVVRVHHKTGRLVMDPPRRID